VTAAAIEEHRDVAEELRSRYRHFVVDEYQDVSPLQQRLLEAWLGGRDDLCVVGDPNQTIYSFTGATPSYLLDFPRRFPGTTVVRLVRDYRSTPQVVELANRVLGRRSSLRLVGQRGPGPEPAYAEYEDEPAEAAAVASACRGLLAAGTPASELAVLFRVNAQSEAYERALSEAGVPYVLRGGERCFDRTEIREALLLLRGAVRSAESGLKLADVVRDVLSALNWSPAAPPPGGTARERWESLAALVAVAEELAAVQPEAGLGDFVAELEQRAAAQHAPTVQGVTLASLHAAKGLEWDAVFLVGLVEGTLPIQHAVTDEQVDEERRLLYVGITRARERLSLSWSLSRTPGGRRGRRRTRFLHGIVAEPAAAARPAKVRRRGGGPTELPDGADAELFARLRAWRSERAEAQKVPAYVVFSDATLAELAVRQPADVAGLVAVPGIGQTKLDRYGEDVLALVRGDRPPSAGD
jgi:DNA helicase-2/ATP-dependent DNA helicase PcrA